MKIIGVVTLLAVSLPVFCSAGSRDLAWPIPERVYKPVTSLGNFGDIGDADMLFGSGVVICKDTTQEDGDKKDATVYLDMTTKHVIWKSPVYTFVFGLSTLDAFFVEKSFLGKRRVAVNMVGIFVEPVLTSDSDTRRNAYVNHVGGVQIVSSSAVGSSQNGKWYAIASFFLMNGPNITSFTSILSCESSR